MGHNRPPLITQTHRQIAIIISIIYFRIHDMQVQLFFILVQSDLAVIGSLASANWLDLSFEPCWYAKSDSSLTCQRRDSWGLQGVWPGWERLHLQAGTGHGHALPGLHAQRGGAGGHHPKTGYGRWAPAFISLHLGFRYQPLLLYIIHSLISLFICRITLMTLLSGAMVSFIFYLLILMTILTD